MEFKDALKRLRCELGITQMELASALHVNFSTVSRWELGKSRPNRSTLSLLLEYSGNHSVSKDRVDDLVNAIKIAKKEKLGHSGGRLPSVDHTTFGQLVDGASFPIYVCDMETDDLLYLNRKAEELFGGSLDRLPSRKCYVCMMNRKLPCSHCNKNELTEDEFVCHEQLRPDGTVNLIKSRLVLWNGKKAHIRIITGTVLAESSMNAQIVSTLLRTDYESITTIDAVTGEAHPFSEHTMANVIAEQKRLGDNEAGVEAILRKHCADSDIERVIKETSLPYIKEQLETKPTVSVTFSLGRRDNPSYKRVLYTYLDETKTTLLSSIRDITEEYRQEAERRNELETAIQTTEAITRDHDQLRAVLEQNRIAMEKTGLNIARYDIRTGVYYNNNKVMYLLGYGDEILNMPEVLINDGNVAPECADEYRAFYSELRKGVAATGVFALRSPDNGFRWKQIDSTLIYDDNSQPYQAVLVYRDVTEQREQAAVYAKWQNSLIQRDPDSFTLFRCNLSKGASFDIMEGNLLRICFSERLSTFNERSHEYGGRFVHLDDYDAYTSLVNSEHLLANYYRGVRTLSMDYRERVTEGEYRWIHVTIETVQYPDSSDIEVFMMYEPTTDPHAAAPAVEPVETDSLTGLLCRTAFMRRFEELIASEPSDAKHAMLMIDVDNFKRINDNFGHAVGDQALKEIAETLKSVIREGDLLGRLGGDEFLLCSRNIPSQAVAEQRAIQMQTLMRKTFSVDITLSASIGIALYPYDGRDFNTLYHASDLALYTAKANGRDTVAFYDNVTADQRKSDDTASDSGKKRISKRMLVIDDDPASVELIKATFRDAYAIEVCADEKHVLSLLHRFGLSPSVVLLSLDISQQDSYAVLDKIRSAEVFKAIPVIAFSKSGDSAGITSALQHGANDFFQTPIDESLLKIRVDSAMSGAKSERLRAQNAYLQKRLSDDSKFRSVFENTGTVVVEYDWQNHSFTYDPNISTYIWGRFDDRSIWQIFMSDMVADVKDVRVMQQLIYEVANDKDRMSDTFDLLLKTPNKTKHWFTMNVFKRVNDLNITSKIILTFLDVNDNILASKKLRFQAEHDELTGLLNRSCFIKTMEDMVKKKPGGAYVLLCCDINDFRFINERFGRAEGDKLLRYSAEKLLVHSESLNGCVGRLSNDVFAILLPNTPGMFSRTTAIIQSFFEDYPLNVKITGRAGAYIITNPTTSADLMLDRAAIARNTIKGKFDSWLAIYDESFNEKQRREKDISDRMEAALADGQFDVFIQPQFHHATSQLVGGEALVRWIDPQKGLILPNEFIPIFEKNGFITKLDEYVWERTAQYLNEWIKCGIEPVPISVNVSREDTNCPDLCKKLVDIVEKYSIPINLFRLEITESLFAQDTKRLVSVVEQLHEAGFLIEMDDFGSGYSSLNILKDVPVDILKLDMRFFTGNDNLGRGGMIINAVMRMSRWLNIPVVAEGVEIRDQAEFLLSVGCPTIQGYIYEKPLPAICFRDKLLTTRSMQAVPQNHIESNLNSHNFWNPLSSDSQLFNDYIGAAIIFEYFNGNYEILRMNRRSINLLNIKEDYMLPACGLIHCVDEYKPKLKKAILDAIYTGGDTKADLVCVLEGGSRQLIHATFRVIAKAAERAMIFATMEL